MRKRIVAVLTILALLLAACGRQAEQTEGDLPVTQTEEPEPEEIRWRLEETKLPDGSEALEGIISEEAGEHLYGLAGTTVYRIAGVPGTEVIQTLKPPYTEWENTPITNTEWVEGSDCILYHAALCEDEIQMVLMDRGEDVEVPGWYLAKWTPEAGISTEPVVSEHFNRELVSNISSFYTAQDGTSYFMTATEGVHYFDSAFQEKKTWLSPGWVWQFVENEEDEKVYFCGSSVSGKFCIWTVESIDPVLSSDDVLMDFTGKVVFLNASEGYLCTPEGIWQFHLDSGEMEQLMDFKKDGYFIEKVYGAQINGEGNLLIAVDTDEGRVLLERVIDENWRDRKELVLATFSAGTFLSRAVADFNRQGGEYYITLRERGEDEYWEDYRTRIQVEVGTGGGPDIVDSDLLNLHNAVAQGVLRNLEEDLAEEKGRMLENAREAGEVNGELFAVPYWFQLNTLAVSSDIVGDKEYWTAEEFMEYVRASGVEEAIARTEGMDLFWYLVRYGDLIDWENGKSYLNSSKAVERLEFAKEYASADLSEDSYICVAEGRTLATNEYIWGLVLSMGSYVENFYEGKEVYIGYPVDDYPAQSGNRMNSAMLSVNQACKYPEGAIAFIRYLLSQETQRKLARWDPFVGSNNGFPVDAEALEYVFQYTREKRKDVNPVTAYWGTEYAFEMGAASEEVMEKIYKALLSAKAETYNISPVWNIIYEETAAYFSGDKTAQEVCDTMQNRVQLHLDETH